jgi:hypothetical protein
MKSGLIWAALLLASPALPADTDLFPLQTGNRWVLQTSASSPEMHTIEVLRSRVSNGTTWFLVSGYAPGDRWLRKAADGTIYALNEQTGAEEILARVAQGGARYRTSLSGCEQTAQAAAQLTAYRGPHYTLDDALAVAYTPEGCADIGITQDVYAPGVGLVSRAITTFRGELAFHLVYARVGGTAVLGKSKEIVVADDFHYGSHGWLPGFTDYSLRIGDLRMLAEIRGLPDEINPSRSGYYIQSMNRSDDVFMFLKKHVDASAGLEPDRAYRVSFDIRFASNAPSGCFGIGGAPGESVYLKAGAAVDEPLALLDLSGDIRLSADKGQQANGGRDAGVVGNIANGTPCEGSSFPYVRVRKQYAHPGEIRTDARGSMWLFLGTDSGFEGLTGLYVESVTVRINSAVLPAIQPMAGARRR